MGEGGSKAVINSATVPDEGVESAEATSAGPAEPTVRIRKVRNGPVVEMAIFSVGPLITPVMNAIPQG